MKFITAILSAVVAISSFSCKSESSPEQEAGIPPEIVPEIQENQLADEPSAFLSQAADSKINWQSWTPEVLEYAQKAQRMILVVIGSARYSGCVETLEALERNPSLVKRINESFIPVLTDIDLTRETSLLANYLSNESKVSVSFPFLMLLSPEGNPVTWHPIRYDNDREIQGFFDNSLEVVSRLWNDSPSYVSSDSETKASLHRERLPSLDDDVPELAERQRIYQAAMRRLGSYYDEDVESMAGSGGLFPFGILDMLSIARCDQTLPLSERQKYGEALESFVQALLSTAMIDVLDGGMHSARRGSSWNLVMGRRECSTQARAGRIFARMHQLNNYPGALEAAVGAVRFAEERYKMPNGLFSLSAKPDASDSKDWLWTIDQVSSVLNDDEFKVWKAYSELSEIGNLPSEADPNRNHFRLNSLSAALTPQEVSQITGIELEQVQALIGSGRRKLLKARENRSPRPAPDRTPSALASFRMSSAYASLYTATGDPTWLDKAVTLGQASRNQFLSNIFLNERPDGKPEGSSDGRAFSYAIAVQAGLDLGAVTLQDEWYSWAQDLTTLLAEHFVTAEGRMIEVRQVSRVVDIDYEDRMMIFDDSTVGLVRLNLQRLRALGFQTPPALSPWLISAPNLETFPIVYTDTLLAVSHEWNHTLIKVGPDTPEEIVTAITTLPLQLFARRRTTSNGVTIVLPDDTEATANTPDDIKNLLKKP